MRPTNTPRPPAPGPGVHAPSARAFASSALAPGARALALGARAFAPGARALALGAFALALAPVFAAGGCGEVIGLGDEPSNKPSTLPGVCGLEAHPNPDCDACLDEQCCDASLGCFRANDDCVDESQCSLDCAYDTACLGACTARYGSKAYEPLQTCLLVNCLNVCLPTGPCTSLVACCQRIPKENAAYSACIKGTNRNDGDGCQSLLDSRLLDPFCPELIPMP